MSGSMVECSSSSVVALTHDHLEQAYGLSQALNWPYRIEDWKFALELGRGFAVESDGKLVGTALWWPYGDTFATIGMIIVSPLAQRQGIGGKLMTALLADAAGRRMVLNSTKEGGPLYTRLGFVPYGMVYQHQAVLVKVPRIDPVVAVRAARLDDRPAIIELDSRAAGMDRKGLLEALFPISDAVVVERGGDIVGYGGVRRWGRGVVIGPVIARDQTDARAIIATLASAYEGGFVRIDVTEASGLSEWLSEIGLPQVDQVVTMALGQPPQAVPDATLFALSNQSLG
ncbi:GNAT superfamily N-acetyltransferase [Novosphingobium hassiacum]|uniref:GNAT superfamily N-acetyltransferase n=1 Tax=Novosphingobium hassiacum TaxID=173676 RepID=A0A7W5ZX54_9SPHN|nr:GNAT family N-acetyltransferase [Novosphingobium hassiacum]MBB3861563.1 GNAT superfamily N-acetyltransferase [Novosphingobium hassiacum]